MRKGAERSRKVWHDGRGRNVRGSESVATVRPPACEAGLTSGVCDCVYASVIRRRGESWRLARFLLRATKNHKHFWLGGEDAFRVRGSKVHRSASHDSRVSAREEHCSPIQTHKTLP